MKLEEIEFLWDEDVKIDRSSLDEESLRIPYLHSKYYKLYLREKVTLKSEQNILSQFYKTKHEYYTGKLSGQECKDLGWEPFPFILKGDIQVYLDADKELADKLLKIMIQKEKVDFLESIIKTLNTRNFLIKNAIDFRKFANGG
jgi:hypothetical protein